MKNMIIWINGANGVGKSNIAAKLAEHLTDKNAECVESDQYWQDFLKDYFNDIIKNKYFKEIKGLELYKNKLFLNKFREILDEKMQNFSKMLIVPISLVDKLCETELLDYFEKKNVDMLHIILEATRETIIFRIENDLKRDKIKQNQQKFYLPDQLNYLKTEYSNAARINTEDKNWDEIINEIMTLL